ncbi:MAG: DUF2442 domain-containing protein [Tepidisphaeraceae bacterium]
MSSSAAELERTVRAKSVAVTDDAITVKLDDGRSVSVPTKWYPRLLYATPAERANYEIDSYGISWPEVEADFSIRGILLGHKSGESTASLKFWLNHRRKGRKVTVEDYIKKRRTQPHARRFRKSA